VEKEADDSNNHLCEAQQEGEVVSNLNRHRFEEKINTTTNDPGEPRPNNNPLPKDKHFKKDAGILILLLPGVVDKDTTETVIIITMKQTRGENLEARTGVVQMFIQIDLRPLEI
jgi:hypothetical protein